MSLEFHCPSCGKKLFSYEMRERRYGSPLKKCNTCETEYIDPRFFEPALSGIPEDEFKMTPYLIMLAFGAFILWRGIHLTSVRQLGTPSGLQWLMPAVLILFGIALLAGGVYEIFTIKTGLKQKKFDKIMTESKNRIGAPSYVYKLWQLGYPVPESYVEGFKNRENNDTDEGENEGV